MDYCLKGMKIGPLEPQALELGAKVYHYSLTPLHLGYIRGLEKTIKEGGYDIVHNHLTPYAGLGVFAAKRCGVPVITSFHNTVFAPQLVPNWPFLHKLWQMYSRLSIRYAVRHSNVVTGDCKATYDYIMSHYPFPAERGKILFYGVTLTPAATEAQKLEFLREIEVGSDRLLIAHVGRFQTQKNHEGLVRVAARVLAQDPRAHFVLVGDGPLRPGIEEMVKNLNLTDHFSILGRRVDVERILSCCDLFFFPSNWEGIPVAVLEAMSASLPVLASDLPEIREETVEDGVTGILWLHQDEAGMAAQLLALLQDQEKREAMGQAGRARIEAEFSIERGAERLHELYESVSHS
jgi:glycosyltransferase involved in cell wall biosynthesis